MSIFNSTSSASSAQANFNDMLKHFGVVTVMNAKVFKRPLYNADNAIINEVTLEDYKAYDILQALQALDDTEYVRIDTLKIANINMEGPTKTVTGGQYVNPLIKFGKTATIEMQDALGRGDVIELLGGGIIEDFSVVSGKITDGNTNVLHMSQDFAGAKTILGESFFIDQKTGAQVKVYVLLYEMLPDSIMNLTQDAEGDATVFDLNGSLSAVDILISDNPTVPTTGGIVKGVFYSILPQNKVGSAAASYKVNFALCDEEDDPQAIALVNGTPSVIQSESSYALPAYTGFSWYDAPSEGNVVSGTVSLESAVTTFYLEKNE